MATQISSTTASDMEVIQTKSFNLASVFTGDPNANRIAILIPGRLDTKDYINFTQHAELLSELGFYTIAFDYPGTWESPGDDIPYTTTNYIKAVNELIEHFGNKPTLLLGHSRGGQTAILTGCTNPNVIGVVAVNSSFGPPSPPNLKKIVDGHVHSTRDLPPGDSRTKKQKDFQIGLDYWEDGKQYDARKVLKACTVPKLIIHGTRDEFHNVAEVEQIYNDSIEPKTFKVIESEHDYRLYPRAINQVDQFLRDFLENL